MIRAGLWRCEMTRKTVVFAARYDEETLREWVAAGWIQIEAPADRQALR